MRSLGHEDGEIEVQEQELVVEEVYIMRNIEVEVEAAAIMNAKNVRHIPVENVLPMSKCDLFLIDKIKASRNEQVSLAASYIIIHRITLKTVQYSNEIYHNVSNWLINKQIN